jgi:glutamate-1-semialdehyde 2,1-aminomutase
VTPDALKLHLQEAQDRYAKSNPGSFDLFKSGLAHMPGANTRSVLHIQPFPVTIARGESATLVDVDGHEYLDFLGEFSAGVYGHSSPLIKKAIIDALDKGWNFGGKNEYEVKLAKILVDRFSYSMDSIRFCNSGTEANLMALGAAVNFTRKQKVSPVMIGDLAVMSSFTLAKYCRVVLGICIDGVFSFRSLLSRMGTMAAPYVLCT